MNIKKLQFDKKQTNNWIPLNLSKVLYIVIHHTAIEKSDPHEINKWHLENGWNGGFGYNEYITKDGTIYIGRGDNIGAHTANMNSKSYGICVEGNYNKEPIMSIPQFGALVERVNHNKKRFNNFISVEPHSKFNKTSCPGKYFNLEYLVEKTSESRDTITDDIAILQRYNIIKTPEYWQNNAVTNGVCKGEYVQSLIFNMANYFK